tara:strand:+ start:178 stop:420 length:243 start_codon:yes stop_codon:yes gene_type:complete
MIFKVHWIVDGLAEIEAKSKEEAEKILQEELEDYVKKSDPLMNKFVAKSIQGSAYMPGSDEETSPKSNIDNKEKPDEENS